MPLFLFWLKSPAKRFNGGFDYSPAVGGLMLKIDDFYSAIFRSILVGGAIFNIKAERFIFGGGSFCFGTTLKADRSILVGGTKVYLSRIDGPCLKADRSILTGGT